MSELSFHQQAVLWGQAYEVLVKRGVLACLIEQGLIAQDRPGLERWRDTRLLEVSRALTDELQVLDESARDVIKAGVRHLALTAYGVGYTATRAYLQSVRSQFKNPSALQVKALWCPLMLPGESTLEQSARAENREAFYKELSLPGVIDPDWSRKGQPANADFMLWLSAGIKDDYLLVQEYSYDMPPSLGDFREQGAHLDELTRHRRIVDSRSVFARVAAEVEGETFELSEDVKNYLGALTSENKPFYKLCQASSYAESTVLLLQRLGMLNRPCMARALAITPNGLESLVARFEPDGEPEPRREIMAQMGVAYRNTVKIPDGGEAELENQINGLFKGMVNKLPERLRLGMKDLRRTPQAGEDYLFEFDETVPQFANPTDKFSLDDAIALVPDEPRLDAYFGQSAKEAVGASMRDFAKGESTLSLRDMHAAAIVAGMQCAKSGTLNVLALEGNPGIGKTTALRTHLGKKQEGYLFLYVSPRVVINRDVTESLARNEDKSPTGILTITTNAPLIAAAESWHKAQVEKGLDTTRHIDGAVVADGVPNLTKPQGSMLVLDPRQEEEIDAEHAGNKLRKDTLSEHEDLVKERPLTGVLKGMSTTARELLALNPVVNRMVLTAALQGFRERDNAKTTIDALSSLFVNKASTGAGREERRVFARRMQTIVVMVDELAGDGAGAGFVHTIANWLGNEFIDCFEDEPSPFTVTLVVSDASLGNEVVLERYLNAGDRTPDKVLVSKSSGETPFRLAATSVKIGCPKRKRETLHVMTNSYPASELHLHYRVKLTAVKLEESTKHLGELQTPREAIRKAADEAAIAGACQQILKALDSNARQVIYFAQDKQFLRKVKTALAEEDAGLTQENVQVLDSSVPGWKRKELVAPGTRDKVRVFLMTSSGARGVSFPLTDWIIASVPRFNIESALMEIAQLIYRGRGMYVDEHGERRSGDRVPRHLVMLVDDFIVSEDEIDKRQWLRQSLDLMTLLVMLRSTIFTRITGDSGLRQPLALVPVGAVGTDELISLMSQYVAEFVKEAEVFKLQSRNQELVSLALRAKANVEEIFSRAKLHGVAKKDADGRSMVKARFVETLLDLVASPIGPLLACAPTGTSVPDHIHFSGPVTVETWRDFEKQEVFAFEGHETQLRRASRALIGQLHEIYRTREFPSAMRVPATNLLRLLQRDQHDAANEFRTLKELKSPNTWVAVPAGYYSFLHPETADDDNPFRLDDQALWQEALGRTLNAGAAIMPPLPCYDSFPWAASVGEVSPLKLDTVFDDRYFMASNELNLLNTLLLAKTSVM
ncbi:helicase (plasmid) [Cupriavidus sp. P-10]|uniref:helicase n=1 Tax=Cupriavidus sp. P-10 TaxID=2027911 RepID=UPI000E2F340A|nr:helicase [Cupriavidus sp. P-10]BDB29546.1 helicase [Cupriavidus sp. P-10]